MLERAVAACIAATAPLDVAVHHLPGEPVPGAEAAALDYAPCVTGERWGPRWGTAWFRLRGTVPPAWVGSTVAVRVALGGPAEGLLWADGAPLQAVDREHGALWLRDPGPGDAVELHLEAACNPPPWRGHLLLPHPGGEPLCTLDRAELALVRGGMRELCLDLALLLDLARRLPDDRPRGAEILAALQRACTELDLTRPDESAGRARAELAAVLASPAAASALEVNAVGHAHIDSAWLWPVRETVRKCARTFSTALRLLEERPEHRFVCSQAQQWAFMRDHHPGLFARMRDMATDGRFEPVGSMWVEADCNIPSGESLVRQVVHGRRFFLEELGVETVDMWLPDAFGYSAALPQILAGAGVRYFMTAKMAWNDTNRLPHSTFWWEGLDGTRVLAHLPPADTYWGDAGVADLMRCETGFRDHGRSRMALYPFGQGDGGGGPTREQIDTLTRCHDLEGLPRVRREALRDWWRRLEAEAGDLAVWSGELYFEKHRGTYTTQAGIKAANRRCEWLLGEAELWSCRAHGVGAAYPAARLEAAWRALLLQQFHDILPGTSIHWVNADAAAALAGVEATAHGLVDDAVATIAADVDTAGCAAPVLVLNPLGHARTDLAVASPAPGPVDAAVDPDGGVHPVQRLDDGRIAFVATVPPAGHAVYDLRAGVVAAAPAPARATARGLENALLRVAWDGDGALTSVHDREAGREVLREGGRGNLLEILDDEPDDWDAWDLDAVSRVRPLAVGGVESITVVEDGPLRAAVRMVRPCGAASRIVQTLRLATGSRRLDLETEVEWQETHRLLRVSFPVAVHATRATSEIQFGHVERPTHGNTSWDAARFETCAHTWTDLSESGYGVALLNDGKYGHDVHDGVLRLTLLRSPVWPDPQADRGPHRFTYSLLPHRGDLRDAGVIERAHELNVALRCVLLDAHPGTRPRTASLVRLDGPGVTLTACKRADREDALVLRLHEAWGGRRRVRVEVDMNLEGAWRTDLLERPLAPLDVAGSSVTLELRAFEIATVKLSLAPGDG